jgi:hypothetical protein
MRARHSNTFDGVIPCSAATHGASGSAELTEEEIQGANVVVGSADGNKPCVDRLSAVASRDDNPVARPEVADGSRFMSGGRECENGCQSIRPS